MLSFDMQHNLDSQRIIVCEETLAVQRLESAERERKDMAHTCRVSFTFRGLTWSDVARQIFNSLPVKAAVHCLWMELISRLEQSEVMKRQEAQKI